jgi:membrane-bound ClpP family serine protease
VIMPADKQKRAYTLYSLVRLLFDEAVLAAVVLWIMPGVGINVPLWLLILFMVAWAVYSCLTSGLVAKVISKVAAVGPEVLIGIECTTTTPLQPDGYVWVGTELWRARSVSGNIDVEAEVVIVGVKRLTLLVKTSTDTSFDEGRHIRLMTDMNCAQNECHSNRKPQPRENSKVFLQMS